ncbi:unnamed protein product [Blepharisma stoltei]|uniref:Uncharacterized protein n=1 Tax=Blepharisma stoltei TaxID=1481888 RepID=A0AAU9IJ95_9CILI|nr:unnamed protein product [Blepharisma stoltei]
MANYSFGQKQGIYAYDIYSLIKLKNKKKNRLTLEHQPKLNKKTLDLDALFASKEPKTASHYLKYSKSTSRKSKENSNNDLCSCPDLPKNVKAHKITLEPEIKLKTRKKAPYTPQKLKLSMFHPRKSNSHAYLLDGIDNSNSYNPFSISGSPRPMLSSTTPFRMKTEGNPLLRVRETLKSRPRLRGLIVNIKN